MRRWLFAVVAVVAAVAVPLSCRAQQDDGAWLNDSIRESARLNCHWWGDCYRWHRYLRWRQRRAELRRLYRAAPQVRAYRRYHDDDDDERRGRHERRAQCVGSVDVLSTEHTSEDNAREAARKLWMAKVQWHWGAKYMDLENADDVRWRCGPSNAHDTVSGRIVEGANKLIGREGHNSRCELLAKPCRASREREDRLRARR